MTSWNLSYRLWVLCTCLFFCFVFFCFCFFFLLCCCFSFSFRAHNRRSLVDKCSTHLLDVSYIYPQRWLFEIEVTNELLWIYKLRRYVYCKQSLNSKDVETYETSTKWIMFSNMDFIAMVFCCCCCCCCLLNQSI